MSKQRKPGDYVVNAELTEEQIEEFVRDCVANGATSDGDHLYTNFTALFKGGASVGGWNFIQRFCITDVTEEYKEQPMKTLELPTVLEECAEHIRAGRDPRDYFEINATENGSRDGFIRPNNLSLLLNDAFSVRRKSQTITVNGQEIPKPDDVFWTDIEKEVSFVGERTFVNTTMIFNKAMTQEDIETIFTALRGEHNE